MQDKKHVGISDRDTKEIVVKNEMLSFLKKKADDTQ